MKLSTFLKASALTLVLSLVSQATAQDMRISVPAPKPEHLRMESPERTALRQKIGQLIVIGFQGNDRTDAPVKRLGQQIKRGEVGGVLFLGYNIPRSADDIKDILGFFKENQAAGNHPGLLVALDQEGGKIQRLKPWHGISKLPSAKKMPEQEAREAFSMYQGLACELEGLGFNWNLGPVVDLASNPKNPVIAKLERAYSAEPEVVAEYGAAFVRAHSACGMATSLKHFPGHGSSGTDSHKGLADITDTWKKKELEPYRSLLAESSLEAVMVGHLMHRDVDPVNPSSLSPVWIEQKLRQDMGYDGLVLTDDLDMRAISDIHSPEGAAVEALIAGNDIVLIANGIERLQHLPRLIANAVLEEMETGDSGLNEERLEQSFRRIATFKKKLGLI